MTYRAPRSANARALLPVAIEAGFNCLWACEVNVTAMDYRALRRERVFSLLPEWTLRWREIFEEELDLSGDISKDLMREMHSKLLYLDTGQLPLPDKYLREASDVLGLPWEVLRVGPEHLLAAINSTLKRMREDER